MISIARYDGRDNVQARGELIPGSTEWEEYYRTYPELKDIDLAQHDLPGVIGVCADVDNKFFLSMVTLLGQLGHENMVDGPVESKKAEISPAPFFTAMEQHIYGDYNPAKCPYPQWMEEPPPVWVKYPFGRKKG